MLLRASLRALLGLLLFARILAAAEPPSRILIDAHASALERFASRELQRYVYLRTGALLPIEAASAVGADAAIILTRQDRALARAAAPSTELAAQSFRLRFAAPRSQQWILGGDDAGTLYGVYRFAEHLGVRFYLHGDVIPDERFSTPLPAVDETGQPLFSVRGLQPFHDFAPGPDWWNTDDYLAVIGQLAKLRLNFLGLHTYPEGDVGPEPTVWIGRTGDYDDHGHVREAYPASYHTTGRSGRPWWGYAPMNTSDFAAGAAALFERDDFGAEVMRGEEFSRQTPLGSTHVFNRTADMLATAFAEARRLSVLTCIGTETPLTLPARVRDDVVRDGREPNDPALAREIYRAMFDRIAKATPVDYFWLWTPEGWTWSGNNSETYAATERDIRAALGALDDLGHPMTLATCGWVLGPQHDRAALDRLLPLDSPMSAINAAVGHTALERQFANLRDRPRWAIPWLENDGGIIDLQLWAGRMRFDAADARRLGCTGLIGIHWRTKILAPNIAALAAAAWNQEWIPPGFDQTRIPPQTASGAEGGRAVSIVPPGHSIQTPIILSSSRVGMNRYELLIPSGVHRVTLDFVEPEDRPVGERVFSVSVQGRPLARHLDLAARGGRTQLVADHVKVANARLTIDFTAETGEPCISAIQVEGVTDVGHADYTRRINCGGPVAGDYEADELPGQPRPPDDRAMPVDDFYRDFARANFGPDAAPAIGALFARIDGIKLPNPAGWIDGPGDILPNPEPWEKISRAYSFVDEFAALRPLVYGAANLERFHYWLSQFRAFRLIAEIGCTAGALDREMDSLASAPADATARARTQALPLRVQLAALWTQLLHTEIAGADTLGELGTIANLEQRSRIHQRLLTRHDEALRKLLGCDLPADAAPGRAFAGKPRIIVPTVRTAANAGEKISLRVVFASDGPPAQAELCWRRFGEREYARVPLQSIARNVYSAALPSVTAENPNLEYHIEASFAGAVARWPVSDSGLDQTVVLGAGL